MIASRIHSLRKVLTLTSALALAAGFFAPSLLAAEGDATKGAEVYQAQKCTVCHMIDGKGGKMGGDLSGVGTKRDAEWLATYLPNPKAVDPEYKMPAAKAQGQDLDDLVAFLLTLKGEKGE